MEKMQASDKLVQAGLAVHTTWSTRSSTVYAISRPQAIQETARSKIIMEAKAVLKCWNDVKAGKFNRFGGGGPMQMTVCVAQATRSKPVRPDLFIANGSVVDGAHAATMGHSSGLVGSLEDILQHNMQLYKQGHRETVGAVEKLLAQAREAAEAEDEVISSKVVIPPTGDKRTYVSIATYCWPANPDDLEHPKGPWDCGHGHTDGKAFPGRNVIAPDFIMLIKFLNRVYRISSAYYFTADEYWAERASTKIRKFLLAEDTGMLPSLLYAQLQPGHGKFGASTGTIDMKNLYQLFDSIAMLRGSPHWTSSDASKMHAWMVEYATYLTSDHVAPERKSINNHGTYFDLQYISVLRFIGKVDEARAYINTTAKERISIQVHGSMLPSELIRPKSYAYHNFEIEAYVRLALQAQQLGIDLWNFQASTFNSLLDVVDFMAQHWCDRGQTLWPVQQMSNPPLENNRPASWLGALFNQVRASEAGMYTQRSLFYAQLFQQFKSGYDPHKEIVWSNALVNHLSLVRMDDCFMTLCPTNQLLTTDPPSYAASCAPLRLPPVATSALPPRFVTHAAPSTTHAFMPSPFAPTHALLNRNKHSFVRGYSDTCMPCMLVPLIAILIATLFLAMRFMFKRCRGYRVSSKRPINGQAAFRGSLVSSAMSNSDVDAPLV